MGQQVISLEEITEETKKTDGLSYVTVLSNWLLGYDRYQRVYSKQLLDKSTYPDEFYLLEKSEIQIGINKGSALLEKLSIPGNTLIRVWTSVSSTQTKPNLRNGLGVVYPRSEIPVHSVSLWDQDNGEWVDCTVEDLSAAAYRLEQSELAEWNQLRPRALSFLPVALACQASCKFCFSESSISAEQEKRIEDFTELEYWCQTAAAAGAERFVITGGGEPTIIKFEETLKCVSLAARYFDKIVLITNGISLSKGSDEKILERLKNLKSAGLSVLSISYHHHDLDVCAEIMGVKTNAVKILQAAKNANPATIPELRLVCVIQQGGIATQADIQQFVEFAAENHVAQVCFKELYVASSDESLYSKSKENIYSRDHQVSLSEVLEYCQDLDQINQLPWGSPIFRKQFSNRHVDIAAYTEPSVGWERNSGLARSWNYMADKKCYASLEDPSSVLPDPELNK
jgi:molybdenum cofactor biosynthesis enzyme MoaA